MLWDYLLTMVEEYMKAAQATIYFPNRPIPIALKRQSPGMIEFQIGDRFVTIGEKKCLREILHGAEHFFTLLNEVSPNRYSLLLEQIEALQGQVQSMGRQEEPVVELGIKAERISLNRILLSWMPNANQNVRKYEILLDNAFVISLPANETSYTHLFQPTDKLGKCIYKLISYDADD